MEILIKKARINEIKKIARFMFEQFSKPPYNEREPLNRVIKSLKFYFKIGEVYKAVLGKEIIGVIVYKKEIYWEGPVFIIEDLAIKDEFKGKGIGKKLMNFLESKIKEEHISAVYLATHKNSPSISFYKRLGYKINQKTIFIEKRIK